MGERIDGILVITDRAPPIRTTPEPAPRVDAMDAPAIPARFTPEAAVPRWSWERDPTTSPEPTVDALPVAEPEPTEEETPLLDPPTDELGADWFDGSLEPQPIERTLTPRPPPERRLTWHVPAGIALVAVAMVASASVLALLW
ncbi:MAG: hypothetical protein KC621_10925 [Myxococcales bacterium]|nr:hypothetical protein [Myxococcales bacterium]